MSASAERMLEKKEKILEGMWSEKAQGRRAQTVRDLCGRGARPRAVSGGGQARAGRRARLSCSNSKRGEAIRIRHQASIRIRGIRSYTAIQLRVIPWAGIAVGFSIQHHHIHTSHTSLAWEACLLPLSNIQSIQSIQYSYISYLAYCIYCICN